MQNSHRFDLIRDPVHLILNIFKNKNILVSGAALHACQLSNEPNPIDVFIVDINSLDFGIITPDSEIRWIINRMTTIPTKITEIISTTVEDQSIITIEIFQGNRSDAKENYPLGKYQLTGISPALQGIPQIEVTFAIDINGMFSVTQAERYDPYFCARNYGLCTEPYSSTWEVSDFVLACLD